MRKIAFFVEGAGEMLFVEKLLTEVAEVKDVVINKRKIRGGGKSGKVAKYFTEVGAVMWRLYSLILANTAAPDIGSGGQLFGEASLRPCNLFTTHGNAESTRQTPG